MRGSIVYQVQNIFETSGINQIGKPKDIILEKIRQDLLNMNISPTVQEIAKRTGIFSYSTADTYRDVWRQIGNYIKSEFNIRDLEQLEGKHIQSYLESKVAQEVSKRTFVQYASASEKLEIALNGFAIQHETGKKYNFSESLKNVRKDASLMLENGDSFSAYNDPKALIKAISHIPHQIAAKIQFEAGSRIIEFTDISEKDLRGIKNDPITGEEKGAIYIKNAKKNRGCERYIKKDTYQELKVQIEKSGKARFIFKNSGYFSSLKNASEKTNQNYKGSNGLRHNFAQFRFQEVQGPKGGQSYERALWQLSEEMYHETAERSLYFLRSY
jgi:hypothetical protein